ncbi:putative E3 ubiquitin-protein ligase RING1a [Cicer arietinum]|uniref:E3 ubiquitin-protein ligase RING1a n=1 Tax=Cicer arietinum TaxID=3827 RepID=A0A1S3EC92_CICAR|nr:putative E3 ubiquitin-protein ligase RING1a [Cicer arietinum]
MSSRQKRSREEPLEATETDISEVIDADTDEDEEEEVEEEEYVTIDMSLVRKEVECPICLGIIRKTSTVMECLHRFCRKCIDKSMRLGNKECPSCRTHLASRRSLKDDPNYDILIATLFPNIDKFEEEEFASLEEELGLPKKGI